VPEFACKWQQQQQQQSSNTAAAPHAVAEDTFGRLQNVLDGITHAFAVRRLTSELPYACLRPPASQPAGTNLFSSPALDQQIRCHYDYLERC
jgi:hypothetical protein